jgi:hypothetical protein
MKTSVQGDKNEWKFELISLEDIPCSKPGDRNVSVRKTSQDFLGIELWDHVQILMSIDREQFFLRMFSALYFLEIRRLEYIRPEKR